MSNEQDFKVGDKVLIPPYYTIGKIIAICGSPADLHYCVKFDTGICAYYYKDELKLVDENPYDRRTAFLTELQALLHKYDAEIEVEQTGYDSMPNIVLYTDGGKDSAYYSTRVGLTADNIMEFDKE